jgi:hypothetical protein
VIAILWAQDRIRDLQVSKCDFWPFNIDVCRSDYYEGNFILFGRLLKDAISVEALYRQTARWYMNYDNLEVYIVLYNAIKVKIH